MSSLDLEVLRRNKIFAEGEIRLEPEFVKVKGKEKLREFDGLATIQVVKLKE